ncbi:hypothetical protein RFI_35526 [Reticulomyxa filosa]|uniref:RING-type domain-containing protein n=1 Tax=Reticulomyxa filosa TaxID=46433 RepID=X6LK03_RETFI|nr:hypothetical protein RFI_35526 [Reticulomyxa filosa]|eukprot:ETO01914.1 hypothetical protein RFI_35526 [Reticulomyxa filosa]
MSNNKKTKREANDKCAICLEVLSYMPNICTPCGHRFHIECITSHLHTSNSDGTLRWFCPICKARLSCGCGDCSESFFVDPNGLLDDEDDDSDDDIWEGACESHSVVASNWVVQDRVDRSTNKSRGERDNEKKSGVDDSTKECIVIKEEAQSTSSLSTFMDFGNEQERKERLMNAEKRFKAALFAELMKDDHPDEKK